MHEGNLKHGAVIDSQQEDLQPVTLHHLTGPVCVLKSDTHQNDVNLKMSSHINKLAN